jgi:hypothetical protein
MIAFAWAHVAFALGLCFGLGLLIAFTMACGLCPVLFPLLWAVAFAVGYCFCLLALGLLHSPSAFRFAMFRCLSCCLA